MSKNVSEGLDLVGEANKKREETNRKNNSIKE